jgi:hypothetical protein
MGTIKYIRSARPNFSLSQVAKVARIQVAKVARIQIAKVARVPSTKDRNRSLEAKTGKDGKSSLALAKPMVERQRIHFIYLYYPL